MDQPERNRPSEGAGITLTPDMRPVAQTDRQEDGQSRRHVTPERPSRLAAWAFAFGALGLVSGLAGLGAALWIQAEGQAEGRRLASEIAQMRVSLDLYARGAGNNAAPSTGSEDLTELTNRLAILEQNWRSGTQPQPAANMPATAISTDEDCLPPGMRILVAEGDSYPVCGQSAVVNVAQVANGYVVLLDGTTIASGGSILMPGSPSCTIGVTSGGDEGLTGYAEIRVTC